MTTIDRTSADDATFTAEMDRLNRLEVADEGSAVHELKTWPEFFEAIADGTKTFELRRADRDYRAGHVLLLREYHPPVPSWGKQGGYTGREVRRRITYVWDGSGLDDDGLAPGFVLLGLEALKPAPGTDSSGQAVQRVLDLADELARMPTLVGGYAAERLRAAVAGPQRDHGGEGQ